jgi:error-prone DNA polymerase
MKRLAHLPGMTRSRYRSVRRRRRTLGGMPVDQPAYAELHCLSHFSFQRGASSADELFERAKKIGYRALAITDECTLAGVVRALQASEREKFKLIVGSEFRLEDGLKLVLLCTDRTSYAALSRIITVARRAAPKGQYRLTRADLAPFAHAGLLALWVPQAQENWDDELDWVHTQFPQRSWIAVERHRCLAREPDPAALAALSHRHRVPRVACGDVHMHVRRRRALQDAMTAIRLRRPVAECGHALFPNGERHLRRIEALLALHPREEIDETLRIADLCRFSLREVKYDYPKELVPPGVTLAERLRELTEAGARMRWPEGVSSANRNLIEKELAIIHEKEYEAFFLTVHDVVDWARSRKILCQGRGSAANSIVCYCLGITSVGPERIQMLFERFVSKERDEAPDIDVDFEHERREEVMQYVYNKYGRERAALAATVISYRDRSAARDLGRALGFGEDQIEQLAAAFAWGQFDVPMDVRLRERGFDIQSPAVHRFCVLMQELEGAPRHLSQHVGGFVISDQPLWELVPVENASMADRTVIQWDKDDLEYLGLLKVDCLALGMLTCLQKCFNLLEQHRGEKHTLASIPEGDQKTYEMIQAADTVGVFQIESRAQMAMLPRLKPENYYDLVIEVAIVRPGPIQGDMVHPYLRRRQKLEEFTYPNAEVEAVLGRTLGIPLFQEQVMKLLEVAADFTPGEADQLRRSMAAWKRHGGLEHFQKRIFDGMQENGYTLEYATRIFEQIKGFGSYGFPESHAASFALLAYVSSYLKCHYPAAFACALINSYPMGFYAPAQLVADLQRHHGEVRPVDVLASDWDCTLEICGPAKSWNTRTVSEPSTTAKPKNEKEGFALRLGFRMIAGFKEEDARRVMQARAQRPFADVADLAHRARLDARARRLLAASGALKRLSGHRHRAFWDIAALDTHDSLLAPAPTQEARPALRLPSAMENVVADYARVGLTLETHPLSLVRNALAARRCRRAEEVSALPDGVHVRFAGLVTVRQRPATASGVTFLTLEDETGLVNAVIWRDLAVRQRRELLDSQLLAIDGVVQFQDGVRHLVAHRLTNYSGLMPELRAQTRDFR